MTMAASKTITVIQGFCLIERLVMAAACAVRSELRWDRERNRLLVHKSLMFARNLQTQVFQQSFEQCAIFSPEYVGRQLAELTVHPATPDDFRRGVQVYHWRSRQQSADRVLSLQRRQ
jgi:hypothetical protein